MIIAGLQKLTLLDYPGKMAATIFTQGCNFRCPFCYNSSLLGSSAAENPISEAELLAFLQKRRGMLDAVCISGGEPLLHQDIASLIEKIKELGYLVKLDTNGSRPQQMQQLVEQGLLDYIAMDIKNAKNRYAETAGVSGMGLEAIEKSVDYLLQGNIDYEFRTTIVKELHTPQDIVSIAKWLQGAKKYYLQSFRAEGDVLIDGLHACSSEELAEMLNIVRQYVPAAELRGD